MNSTPRSAAMTARVVRRVPRLGRLERRHRRRDGLVPVRATAPDGERPEDEDDRDRPSRAARLDDLAGEPSPRTTIRNVPIAIISSADPTNRYVGTAKMLPASRIPRRLPIVMRAIAADADQDPFVMKGRGNAETICSTADDVDPRPS
jgi:hypothetical protein